jgi:hypothetical protein
VTNKRILVLPFWVEQVLSRNKCSLDACLDYKKIRQYLSLEDLAVLLCVQDLNITAAEDCDKGALFRSWLISADVAQKAELQNSVQPLSCNNELIQDIKLRLQDTATSYPMLGEEENENKIHYRISDPTRDVAFLIVYPGFLQKNAIPQYRYNVVVELLKVFYQYMKIHQVSRLPLFSEYIRLFKSA